MKIDYFKKLKIPDKPGVYLFLRGGPASTREGKPTRGGEILYIGKATSLRDRLKSYFGKDLIAARGPILVEMVFRADKIKWKTTDSVLEAVILEANLIKKHQPKYNTKEKSDKSFNYVCITREEIPKLMLVRGKELRAGQDFFRSSLPRARGGSHARKNLALPFANVFGPFPNGSQLKEALKIIRKIFPFLDDKSKNYVEFYRQINLAPDLEDQKLYKQNIKNIVLFFEGKKKKILKNLEKEMRAYAKAREFERAGEVKRQIFALKHINDVALIKDNGSERIFADSPRKFYAENFLRPSPSLLPRAHSRTLFSPQAISRIEAYDIAHLAGRDMVGVMTVVANGEAEKGKYRKFKIRTQKGANDTGALLEVLKRRFAHPEWQMPNLVVVDGSTAQINVAKGALEIAGISAPVVSVVKDEKHKPKYLKGDKNITQKYESEILLANSEAHRFAIAYHKKTRAKSFLGQN